MIGRRAERRLNGRARKPVSGESAARALATAVLLAAMVGQAGAVFAADATGVEADWVGTTQVLVIPQQCSREAVSTLCDRGDAAWTDAGARRDFAYGTLADYEHQSDAGDAAAPAAFGYVTIPVAGAGASARSGAQGAKSSRGRALTTPRHPRRDRSRFLDGR